MIKNIHSRGTLVAQWLGVCLWLRGPGIESHITLPAGSLLLPLPVSLPLSVCLSGINKSIFKKKINSNAL